MIKKAGLDIVRGCQLRCLGCPNSMLKQKTERVSIDVFRQILINIGIKRIETLRLFNFGEPLLHDKLPELLLEIPKRLKANRVEIATNGQSLNVSLLKDIFATGVLTHLYVSCDGNATPQDYERLRPPAKWIRLMEFMDTVRSLNPSVKLGTLTICEREKDKAAWRKILKGWKPEFRKWGFRPQTIGQPWGKKFTVPKGTCKYLRSEYLYVDINGDVVPCCVHPKPFVLGNLLEQNYMAILKGRTRRRMIATMKHNRTTIPICNECGKQ